MHKKHEILRGLKLIHHGLYDLSHNNRIEGEALIEEGAEQIQRSEFIGFPSLFRPHPRHHHLRTVGHIIQPQGILDRVISAVVR